MQADEDNPLESEGVANPGGARGPDGELYLFPRLVAHGNYSRIGMARVRFDQNGEPMDVERLGIALEPDQPYEKNPFTGGGCEDARVTYVEPLKSYVMTYTAFSPLGPRVALAVSQDLFNWTRLGLVHFAPAAGIDFDAVDNKDALIFPTLIENPGTGRPSLAIIHRPYLFFASQLAGVPLAPGMPRRRARSAHPSIWISYRDWPDTSGKLWSFGYHHRLLSPRTSWEQVKVGGGTPPLQTEHGWLIL
ncbi:MAG: glycosidase, partial [Chloroflexota bacterium]|nr:glycosidase [Chloroflexota bacterium]